MHSLLGEKHLRAFLVPREDERGLPRHQDASKEEEAHSKGDDSAEDEEYPEKSEALHVDTLLIFDVPAGNHLLRRTCGVVFLCGKLDCLPNR